MTDRYILTLIAVSAMFTLATLLVAIFPCTPIEKWWNPLLEGRCIDTIAAYLASAIFNLISDVAILVLPIYLTSKLKMPLRRKLGVCAIFTVGIL